MTDIAIKFENITKQYRLGEIGTGTLSHNLNRKVKNEKWNEKSEKLKVRNEKLMFRVYRSGFRHSETLNLELETCNPNLGAARYRLWSKERRSAGYYRKKRGRKIYPLKNTLQGNQTHHRPYQSTGPYSFFTGSENRFSSRNDRELKYLDQNAMTHSILFDFNEHSFLFFEIQ